MNDFQIFLVCLRKVPSCRPYIIQQRVFRGIGTKLKFLAQLFTLKQILKFRQTFIEFKHFESSEWTFNRTS